MRNFFIPSAVAARLWSVPLQDQESEGKEVSRVKGKKVMLKLHHALFGAKQRLQHLATICELIKSTPCSF